MKYVKKIQCGFTITELLISISVLGILLVCFGMTLHEFRNFNGHQLVRQKCISAAQAQLDSIAVTGQQISREDFEKLWPEITYSIEITDGNDQWTGLKLVSVRTSGRSYRREITINLSRYIKAESAEQCEEPIP